MDIGVDIGGTFTDIVLREPTTGSVRAHKVLTDRNQPARSVALGLEEMVGGGSSALGAADRIVHGTTLVANAVIERRGACTGLITTRGFRDVLEMRRENRHDLYDLLFEAPPPLVSRQLRKEVNERIRVDGGVEVRLDPADVRRAILELRDLGMTSLAVCLLHAFRDPVHEQAVAAIARDIDPSLPVSLSTDVAATVGEYERMSTTVINAYVRPIMNEYLGRLVEHLRSRGFSRELLVMLCNGGVAPVETARRFPVRALESGPAAGMMAAARIAAQLGLEKAIGFDMGGTTAKACLIVGRKPQIRTEFEVARSDRYKRGSGYPVAIPAIDMIEIGAGGGSLASVDRLGIIRVGPESAGAHPGPACYGFGGELPTVTDADLLLGYLDPEYFLGGKMPLSREAALRAIKEHVADPLLVDVVTAAWGVHDAVNEAMATAVRVHLAEKGEDPQRFSLIAFGGAGPVHAYALARKLGIRRVVVPPQAGVESALGLITSPLALEVARSHESKVGSLDPAAINALLSELEERARILLTTAEADDEGVTVQVSADMRYVGQTHVLTVGLPVLRLPPDSTQLVRTEFENAYKTQFGGTMAESLDVEIITWRVTAGARTHETLALPRSGQVRSQPMEPSSSRRSIRLSARGEASDCLVYRRQELSAGFTLNGPAIFEEDGSTTVAGVNTRVLVDNIGNLVIQIADVS